MARKIIDIGNVGNDGTGDSIRDSFRKVNDNFRELYSSLGLGENLSFISLDDVSPQSYSGQVDTITGSTPVVTINNTASGVTFKRLVPGVGIDIDFQNNDSEILISSEFSEISADPSPQLGGDLSATSGGVQYRIKDLVDPISSDEAARKGYVDTKISRAGVNAIDPASGSTNAAFGTMTGPLILSRSPEPDDDELYDGLVAATKSYVDNSSYASGANLYVAVSGSDYRPGIAKNLQGRALAYAFRTLEAALRRAEELINESRVELGPYKKVLTYNNGASACTLSSITTSPSSGSGFTGTVTMSVDTAELLVVGSNYFPGDIITLSGGTIASGGEACRIEVLTTVTTPGAVSTFRILNAGSYSVLPGSVGVGGTITTAGRPSVGPIGAGATFDLTYRVSGVQIVSGGSGYSLVSLRIEGGGGSGAFGTAIVTGGVVTGVIITDPGSDFTTLPTLVADLPRFSIFTGGLRTDFTGDVLTNTEEAIRGRDIREGLYLRGEESGALAQILSHDGSLDSSGNEIFDVDIKFGAFTIGETIAYGDVSVFEQISILVESGTYEESLPLKVPQNVAIIGDEFRRVIVKPKPGTSSSPWAFLKFRRDTLIDGLTTSSQLYGYHYLQDPTQPVYPKIDNKGDYDQAGALLELNRAFLQEEVISWINDQIDKKIAPFDDTPDFEYNEELCKRDVGLIVDAIIFDLKYGEYNRTISAGLKYYESASGRIAITTQLSETLAGIDKLRSLIANVLSNTQTTPTYQDIYTQIVDRSFSAESGSNTVVGLLIDALKDVMDGSGSVNYPKENQEMDMFLCNDANILRAVTGTGHGGFMMTLDPTGQILAKSPYAQECASFSRSQDRQVFAGGMFADGFSGNLEFKIVSKVSNTRIGVTGLDRRPNLPCSFIVQDQVYRINYIRDFIYNKDGSSASFILDETTPWTRDVFTYNDAICSRDTGLIIDGLGYDLVLGTNYNARKAGSTYRQANAAVVIADQLNITSRAIGYAHDLAAETASGVTVTNVAVANAIASSIDSSENIIRRILERGITYSPDLSIPSPTGLSSALQNAKDTLLINVNFIKDEVIGWINAQIAGSISPFTISFTYDPVRVVRDTGTLIEALVYDLIYGGNSQTVDAGLKYYDGVGSAIVSQIPGEEAETAAFIDYIKYLAKQVIVNAPPVATYSGTPQDTATYSPSDVTTQNLIESLLSDTSSITSSGVGSAPAITYPNLSAYAYDADYKNVRTALQTDKSSIQSETIDWIDENGNKYELLMPGNRSMLANDFTQVNDMGYGALATNGGLLELVSMFTYYCYVSYYSINGAQIRSVGGSSAHGIYALVAEGSDPLEVPTPTGLAFELSQRCDCYFPSPAYANSIAGLFLYVYNYNYAPLANSELEVDHGGVIFRYPITSTATSGLPTGVARLNLTSDPTGNFEGLFAAIPNNTKMTIRMNAQVILTGGLENVAVRPSTGLILNESDVVYRVLQFDRFDDDSGPYEIDVTVSDPGIFNVLTTVHVISSNVCTTIGNHKLSLGDKFIPQISANGFNAGTTYYVVSVPRYNQFTVSTVPNGSILSLTDGYGLEIKGVKSHKLTANTTVKFDSFDDGSTVTSLPSPLSDLSFYYVSPESLTDTQFSISVDSGGTPLEITSSGVGVHNYQIEGLTKTNLRENYDYSDLTIWTPGETVSGSSVNMTISIGSPAVFTSGGSHGFSVGDVIKIETTGSLPTGLSTTDHYHILSTGFSPTQFRLSEVPEALTSSVAIDTSGTQSGIHTVSLVTGRAGDNNFAIVPVGPGDVARVVGSKFVFKGEEYIITTYENETDTGEPYARITLNRNLEDSIVAYNSAYTIKSGVAKDSLDAEGTLTIRISLTRVTGHDLLEIGTGSYADTNYPNEIYGGSVNPPNPDSEVEERDVGRVFYVTTDQFGNFNVGPYFRVDQGTGQVTFASSIALSNLDGIGFKRGVPIAEFSTDSSFADNATDTVPTENAARVYIERRLGITHLGSPVVDTQLIPAVTGGYMALDGQLGMKANMNLNNNKIVNLTDATSPQDAVNLRSLTWDNFQDFSYNDIKASDILVFTGDLESSVNATMVGDISLNIRTGVDSALNQIDAQINPDTIVNADVKSDAAIVQSKLSMNSATTRANATGIAQADRGLASFDSAQFTATDGWITVKDNGLVVTKIQQIATKTVLGNSGLATANVAAVPFSTVVSDGLAIKKSQYSSTGFLRRTSGVSSTSDGDYTIIEATANATVSTLMQRNSDGDFSARIATLENIKANDGTTTPYTIMDADTTASGGFVRLYGFNAAGGLIVGSGSLSTDKITQYLNDAHQFKTQDGLSNAPITASQIQVQAITTGGNTTAGTITGRWTLTGTSPNESRLQATYSADLAEYYEGDKEYEVGTVLVFGGDKEVTTTNKQADTRVAGVVSNTAAFAMYEGCPGLKNLVALQGRVPVKVVGKIEKGDLIVTSSIPGVAVSAKGTAQTGTVIGKALENYDSDHIGKIEVAVGRS